MIRFIFKNILYVLAILSIVFYYGAYYQYQISQKLLKEGILTEATVVEFVENKSTSGDSKGSTSYAPVYEYVDDSNNIIRYKSPESSSFKFVDIGEKVELLYSKEMNQTRINTTWGLYSFMIIFLFLGSAFLTTVIILFKKKKG